MRVRIEMGGEGEGQELLSLFRWLTRDPDVRRDVAVSLQEDGTGGTMGAADIISAVLSQATGIGSLAVAIATWRDSRAQAAPVKVTAGDWSVIVTGQSAEDLKSIFESLSERGDASPRQAGEPG